MTFVAHPRRHLGSPLRRVGRSAIAASAVLLLLAGGLAAQADTRPVSTKLPATVSSDGLPTVQINGVVWTQLIVGKTVYVGGEFTTARPAGAAPGKSTVKRSNFLAYSVTTGKLQSFAPKFNGPIRAIAVSPDHKRLYVGGAFTRVGTKSHTRIAAIDLKTKKLVSAFKPAVNSTVYGLATTSTRVYAVGQFTSVSGKSRTGAVALSRTKAVVRAFKVHPAGGVVRQIVLSPNGKKAILGGNFTSMNGSSKPGYGLAAADAFSGAPQSLPVNNVVRNADQNAAITSLVATKDGFYGSGWMVETTGNGNLEGSFKADWNGKLVWLEDCHGDTYSVAPSPAGVVYVAGHPHDCVGLGGFADSAPLVNHRALAFTEKATGTITGHVDGYPDLRGKPAPTLLHWFPTINLGTYTGLSQGPWSVTANADYVVYGGEFTLVNGKAQQGLVRFATAKIAPNNDGPRLSGTAFKLTRISTPGTPGAVKLAWTTDWDRDNARLSYQVIRNGVRVATLQGDSTFWKRPTLVYTDHTAKSGTAYKYWITAVDPYGNKVSSSILREIS
jgi:hypothetical protein